MAKKSIIRKYFALSILFGIVMGVIFPFYSNFFVQYKSRTSMIIFTAGCVLAGVFVGVFSFIIGGLTVVRKFKKLSEVLRYISLNKDLSGSIVVDSEDMIGRAFNDFNLFLGNLKTIIANIKNLFDNIEEISFSIANSSEKTSSSVSEICNNVKATSRRISVLDSELKKAGLLLKDLGGLSSDILKHASSQKTNINDSSVFISEIIDELESVAEKTESGKVHISSLEDHAVTGNNEMLKTIAAIEKMNNLTNIVADVLRVINNLNEKTNLLAMNASIEAAHAGQSGKGFAVVANEIRKLAEDTYENSKHIEKSLGEMNELSGLVRDSAGFVGSSMGSLSDGIKKMSIEIDDINKTMQFLSSKSIQTREGLVALVKASNEVMLSSETISLKIDIIDNSLNSISKISNDSGIEMEKINSRIIEINKSGEMILESGLDNIKNINEIKPLIGAFKIAK